MHENKIIVTMQDIMAQMDISDKTLHRMIEEGDLPDFTYGSKWSKKKGWHVAVLERHAMERYERSASFKNISNAGKVGTQNMAIMPLSRGHNAVAKKDRDFDDRDPSKKKLSRKKVPKSVRTSSSKSRVATGFCDVVS